MTNSADFVFKIGDHIWVEKTLPLEKRLTATFVYTAKVKARLVDADTGARFYFLTPYRTGIGCVGFNDQLLPALLCEQTHALVKK